MRILNLWSPPSGGLPPVESAFRRIAPPVVSAFPGLSEVEGRRTPAREPNAVTSVLSTGMSGLRRTDEVVL